MPVLSDIVKIAAGQAWRDVPRLAVEYARASAPVVRRLGKEATVTGEVYYSPTTDCLWWPSAYTERTPPAFFKAAYDINKRPLTGPSWDDGRMWLLVKSAEPVLGGLGHAMGVRPNFWTKALGGPNTLTAALGSGAVLGGLGYGGGWLAEKFMDPDDRRRGRLRNITGLMGLGTGVGVPLLMRHYGWFNDPELTNYRPAPPSEAKPIVSQPGITPAEAKVGSVQDAINSFAPYNEDVSKNPFYKVADVSHFSPTIYVPALVELFNSVQNMSPPVSAATCGLLKCASAVRNSDYVSANDVAVVAAGAGGAYGSGLTAGRLFEAISSLEQGHAAALPLGKIAEAAVRTVFTNG